MFRLKIEGSFFLILDDSNLTEISRHQSKDVEYQKYDELSVDPTIEFSGVEKPFNSKSGENTTYKTSELLDENGVAFPSLNDLYAFLNENLGKSSGGSTSGTTIERLINGNSTATDQQPTGLGEAGAIQIEFGAAQNTVSDPVQLLADGSLVFNEGGMYRLKISIIFGRLGGSGESELRFRALVNGVQAGQSVGVEIDTQKIEIPYFDEAWLEVPSGAIITYEAMRDSSGDDSGGLFQPIITSATAPNWNDATCAAIRVERFV